MVIEVSPFRHGPHIWMSAMMDCWEGRHEDIFRIKKYGTATFGRGKKPNTMCGPNEYRFTRSEPWSIPKDLNVAPTFQTVVTTATAWEEAGTHVYLAAYSLV